MKEKCNFEFPLTTNYGFLRAILDLPQVNCTSAEGARVCCYHSKWARWILTVQNNFEAFFNKRCLFCDTWQKLPKSWVHQKQRKNSWHLHASIQQWNSKESKLIMFQVKIIHNILPTQSSLFQACITDNEVCYLSNLENQALILHTC